MEGNRERGEQRGGLSRVCTMNMEEAEPWSSEGRAEGQGRHRLVCFTPFSCLVRFILRMVSGGKHVLLPFVLSPTLHQLWTRTVSIITCWLGRTLNLVTLILDRLVTFFA
jgi:hypothetical protein